MDLKKIYYYIICLVALFIFFWGVVDLSGTLFGLSTSKNYPSLEQSSSSPEGASEQTLDMYYQKKILSDRLSDSLARVIISGLVFAYSRNRVKQLEA
jgi:hypothetical protein